MNLVLARIAKWGADIDSAISRFCDDEEMYLACLSEAVEDCAFEELEDAVTKKNYKKLDLSVHTIRCISGDLGLNPIYLLTMEISRMLRDEKYIGLYEKCEEILLLRSSLNAALR